MDEHQSIHVTVNGKSYERRVEPRLLLSDFLRHELGLMGTHVGCEHGVCGACTILFDDESVQAESSAPWIVSGESVRSCLLFAVQADGHAITTVEGLAADESHLHPLQTAFHEAHGLQCGFCTPGLLMTLVPFLEENPHPSEEDIRLAISGNLCRCTGYQNIVAAVKLAANNIPNARQ
jgi:aerobic carbon-monoxide dehydrogenase small subunit